MLGSRLRPETTKRRRIRSHDRDMHNKQEKRRRMRLRVMTDGLNDILRKHGKDVRTKLQTYEACIEIIEKHLQECGHDVSKIPEVTSVPDLPNQKPSRSPESPKSVSDLTDSLWQIGQDDTNLVPTSGTFYNSINPFQDQEIDQLPAKAPRLDDFDTLWSQFLPKQKASSRDPMQFMTNDAMWMSTSQMGEEFVSASSSNTSSNEQFVVPQCYIYSVGETSTSTNSWEPPTAQGAAPTEQLAEYAVPESGVSEEAILNNLLSDCFETPSGNGAHSDHMTTETNQLLTDGINYIRDWVHGFSHGVQLRELFLSAATSSANQAEAHPVTPPSSCSSSTMHPYFTQALSSFDKLFRPACCDLKLFDGIGSAL